MFEYCGQGKWLTAVSGGPDSMALLNMCMEHGISVSAAHVNYHHRPQAEEEEEYVRQFCQERGIPLHVCTEPFVWKGNFEAAARTYRYAYFARLCEEYGYAGVMTGQHEDDLLETYIMQREKNLIPAYYGLQECIVMNGMTVYRPLLSKTKKDLEEYCGTHHIRYYIDHTNSDETITRNRIRIQTVAKMGREERETLRREINDRNLHLQKIREEAGRMYTEKGVELTAYRQADEEVRLTVLRKLRQEEKHYTLAYYRELDRKIMTNREFCISLGDDLLVSDNGYLCRRARPEPYCDVYANEEAMKAAVSAYYTVGEGKPSVYAVTLTDEDYPVTVRSPREGDAVQMRFGTKKVSRFFIDRHIPPYERLLWPVVVNAAGTVILLPGLGCDAQHYSVNPTLTVIK